ncbi:flavodoxin-dependent (E)-4-hydroxy-3-methylbut-2-enyl-diphosphate synthase [Spiroplasma endosymbiont of Labia minor]|uniref:flavodoxin-dependent (E)-4-hydroxy-3-methylbut-2-enyl-diphosphate synthase n=1 Tax=Spiroplasma endosymbiont of Labia minor TaxID=3066305 RepID=UPI0030D48F37
MYTRNKTKPIKVGSYQIGGNNEIVIQSMTTTKTHNVKETIKQINKLKKVGCQIVRVAVLGNDDADALKEIVLQSPLPIVADIHFNYKFALIAADAGVAKIRINPGNIGIKEHTIEVVKKCKEKKIPIRIGINSGSLPKKLVEKFGWTAKCMIESLAEHIQILEELNFKDIIYSLKATNPIMTIDAYKLAAERWNYPAHIGITEAGSLFSGAIKSSVGLGILTYLGIGNTIRVSLSTNPIEEIKVAKKILNNLGLYNNIVEVIACPTCGRLEYNMLPIVSEIEKYTEKLNFPLKIAILGCVVNGLGEAGHADIGIAGGHDGGIIFKDGKILKSVKQENLVSELKILIDEYYKKWKTRII